MSVEDLFDDGIIHCKIMGDFEDQIDSYGGECVICGKPLFTPGSKVCNEHVYEYAKIRRKIARLCELARERGLEHWIEGIRVVIRKNKDGWYYKLYDEDGFPFSCRGFFSSQKIAMEKAAEEIRK